MPTNATSTASTSTDSPAIPRDRRALLSVNAHGMVTLSKALLQAIPHLKGGCPVDLMPPLRRGGIWHLDTRPTACRRLEASGKARFRITTPLRNHLLVPAGDFAPGSFGKAAGSGGLQRRLRFRLGMEVTEEVAVKYLGQTISQRRGTGYFALVPVRAAAVAPAPLNAANPANPTP